MKTNRIHALVASALLSAASGVPAHDDRTDKLGSVQFSNSCTAEVQPLFQRGVALLHSFWYAEAMKTFGEVAKADPSCAMAHWGTAIALFNKDLDAMVLVSAPESPILQMLLRTPGIGLFEFTQAEASHSTRIERRGGERHLGGGRIYGKPFTAPLR